jgi:hypothetical protein
LPHHVNVELTLAEQLRSLGVKGILVTMAETGALAELRCMMPECYCPEGRNHFDFKDHPPGPYAPTDDHHPTLKKDGGQRTLANTRLAHTRCNNLDYKRLILPEGQRAAAVARWHRKYSAR